jgi:hypothetical protein
MTSKIYSKAHRHLQDHFGTRKLADKQEETIVHTVFTPEEIEFISGRDMFFLSTMNEKLEPTVSYKGGPRGFIKVVNNHLVFPSYDGNGMYLSVGNLSNHPKVGILFIDFETPRRLRVQGQASIAYDFDGAEFPGAELLVRIWPTEIWVNCPRYIHTYKRIEDSVYTPDPQRKPRVAQWKRLDYIVNSLPEKDQKEVHEAGLITQDEYINKIMLKDG